MLGTDDRDASRNLTILDEHWVIGRIENPAHKNPTIGIITAKYWPSGVDAVGTSISCEPKQNGKHT